MQRTFQLHVHWDMRLRFTEDAFAIANTTLLEVLQTDVQPLRSCQQQRPQRCLVFIDAGVINAAPDLIQRIHRWFSHHADNGLHLAAVPQIISGGEQAKSGLAIAEEVGRCCLEHAICRHSYVIIIGGGAVLDAVGLGASLVHRGVRQIRMPTTVLAQDDAGLGVKNGVNAFGNKNFFGTFQPPWAIINDLSFVRLCPVRERRAGLAEAIKVAIIKDASFFSWLAGHAQYLLHDMNLLQQAIQRCAELHLEHITGNGDPFEQGSSRPLDFGHWAAHHLEVLSRHRLNHGESVAIGLAIDCCYAEALQRLNKAQCEAVLDTLETLGFTLWDEVLNLRDVSGRRTIFRGLEQFREHLGGELTLAMPDGLGTLSDIYTYDLTVAEGCLDRLSTRQQTASQLSPRQA